MVVNWHSSLDISYWQTTSWEDFWIHFFGFWWDLSGSVSLTPCKVFVRSSRWWFIWLRPVAVNWMVCCGSCEQYVPSSLIENPLVVANHYVVVDGDQILCGGWQYGQSFSFETHKFARCLHTFIGDAGWWKQRCTWPQEVVSGCEDKYTTSWSSNLLKTETCPYMFLTCAGMVSAGGRLGSILLEGDQPRNCKYNLCPKTEDQFFEVWVVVLTMSPWNLGSLL